MRSSWWITTSEPGIFAGVIWSGAFTGWIGYLTRWKIDPFVWTDCKLGYFLYRFGGHYSSMLIGVMSVEKFFALFFPLKAKSYCTVGTAKWVTSILAFVIAGLNFPLLILFAFDGNMCVITKYSGLFLMMDSILISLAPIVIMLLANAAIIYKLMYIKYCGISHRNESVSNSSTRGSVMVVTVSLAFIILTSPRAVDSATELGLLTGPYWALFVISMQYLNHSSNGILYCIFGQKFRDELLKILPCSKSNTKPSVSTSTNSVTTDTITVTTE